MNKSKIIIGVAIFSMAVMAGLVHETFVTESREVVEENLEIRSENTQLYAALVDAGIEDAVVDITDERALIRYNLPPNLNMEATWYYIISASAIIAPETDKIVIQTYVNYEPREEITVNTTDVIALMNEGITMVDFQERVKVSDFAGGL